MIAPHRPPVAPYGTDTFAAHLATREQRLGLAADTTGAERASTNVLVVTQANSTHPASPTAPDVSAPDASTPMGDMGLRRDAWGNVVTSAPRLDSAYTFTSRTWESGGRTVYVCGSPAAHVAGGYWQLDRRMSAGQGYVCARCWAAVARQWGIGREWRR